MRRLLLFTLLACAVACAGTPSYALIGQIVAVDAVRQEITVKHEDIKGFMPGMTMAFKVKESGLMTGRKPGDLIRATLVVEESQGYLAAIQVTGHAPLPEPPSPAETMDLLQPGDLVPDVAFIDQGGRAVHVSDWRGRAVAVTFVYTRCPLPDYCPRMDRQFAEVQRITSSARPGEVMPVHLVSVSIDPAFDTPAVLREHARRAAARPEAWSFVTGEREELARFASRFGVSVMREDPKGAEIVHNLRTAVIDPEGRLTKVFGGNEWTVEELVAEIRRVTRDLPR